MCIVQGQLCVERNLARVEHAIVDNMSTSAPVNVRDISFIELLRRSVPPIIGGAKIYDDRVRIIGAIERADGGAICSNVRQFSVFRDEIEYRVDTQNGFPIRDKLRHLKNRCADLPEDVEVTGWIKTFPTYCLLGDSPGDLQEVQSCITIEDAGAVELDMSEYSC